MIIASVFRAEEEEAEEEELLDSASSVAGAF
jgi:hypothetical protein